MGEKPFFVTCDILFSFYVKLMFNKVDFNPLFDFGFLSLLLESIGDLASLFFNLSGLQFESALNTFLI